MIPDIKIAGPESVKYIRPYNEPNFWMLAFPTLFPFGRGGVSDNKLRTISVANFDTHLLKLRNQMFAKHLQWQFARWYFRTERAISSAAFNASCGIQPTAGDLRVIGSTDYEHLSAHLQKLFKLMSSSGKNLKCTPMHIAFERKRQFTMLADPHIPIPTWFFTLSSADLYWPELFIAIDNSLTYDSASKLSPDQRRQMLNANPTLACTVNNSIFLLGSRWSTLWA